MFGVVDSLGTDIIVPDDQPTVQDALNVAQPGDTVVLSTGSYGVFFGLSIPSDDITIRGATGNPLDVSIGCDLGATLIDVNGLRGIVVEDLTISTCRTAVRAVTGAEITLRNVIFTQNDPISNPSSVVFSILADVIVEDSLFALNEMSGSSLTGAIGAFGGSLEVRRSTFFLNTAIPDPTAPSRFGAGIVAGAIFDPPGGADRSEVLVEDSAFFSNEADFGAAIAVVGGNVSVDRCRFSENVASYGGAVFVRDASTPDGPVPGTLSISNSVMNGNRATLFQGLNGLGGAAAVVPGGELSIVNTTFAGNSAATSGGAIHATASSPALVANTLFSANTPDDNAGVPGVMLASSLSAPPLEIRFTDFEGADGTPGTADDDLSLAPGSPAIDAGDNELATGLFDRAGQPRFVDDPGTEDTGSGAGPGDPIVDLGALEFQATPCTLADLAPPFGIVDLDDVDAFIPLFIIADSSVDFVPPAGIVDLDDLDAFISAFLAGCP